MIRRYDFKTSYVYHTHMIGIRSTLLLTYSLECAWPVSEAFREAGT